MKILIVHPQILPNTNYGFFQCIKNLNRIIKVSLETDIVEYYPISYYKNKSETLLYSLFGNVLGVTRKDIEKIKELQKDYDYIFFSTSLMGKLVTIVEKRKSIVFFHNVEYSFQKQRFSTFNKLKKLLYFPLFHAMLKNEMASVKCGGKLVTLNERDSNQLFHVYNRNADFFIPMFCDDHFDEKRIAKYSQDETDNMHLLFVGSDFFGNTEGLFWFIENCMPYIKNCTLEVVGTGMEKYKDRYINKNVRFIGFVDDLSEYYYSADAIVLPIISGSGMKTKTAESLMYGKYIFGTKEAFEGYTIDTDKIGGLCNTAEDFISKINTFQLSQREKNNEYSREIYLKQYSTDAVKEIVKSIFEK